MRKSILLWSIVATLLSGVVLFASAGEPAAQPGATVTADANAPKLPFATPLRWKSTGVLVKPVSDANHTIVSVKDPTIVRYNDLWHIYATAYSTSARTWTMVYLNFKDWSDAPNAKLTFIDVNPNFAPNRYNCAPHLFYFTPHKKWYLVFQAQPPQYCTTEDISKPETWTKPQNFFEGRTAGMPRLPIDYHIICDDTHAYLFFTGDDGNFYRSRTRIEDFPKGMSNPEIAIRDRRDSLFEASVTYKIKGTNTYLTVIEAMSPARYYRAWISDRLDGVWTPVPNADSWQTPFAGINNVTFEDGAAPWTRDISHGELIRDGYDERMILDPNNLQFLYQGRDPASGGRYELLPYQLGLLRSADIGKGAAVDDADDPRGKMQPWETGARETGKYRNVFLEAGYKQQDIDAKLAKAYHDLFEGPNRVYFEVGDSMAYVSDLKNHDARTEGLSYGMMVAVQLNKKDVFDRLWRWTAKYMQHQEGPREAYFAWSVNPQTGKHNSEGSASDGELYFVTDLLFASNRWGNDTGIDYYAEARRILDAMWSKDGTAGIRNVINVEHKMITFVPEGRGYNWTDPSYHIPAFYEVWAEYAKDGHEDFYRQCAEVSRQFLHRACHPVTGLTPDYAEFSGVPLAGGRMSAFGFDSWRVPMNIALDYSWSAKDKEWQQDYCRRIQGFLFSRGIDTFEDQFNIDGSARERIMSAGGYRTLRHSLGLVATSAAASLMGTQAKSWKFVDAVWNAKLEPYEDGYFDPYYDGFLYLFSLMHLSGNYRIITPGVNS